MRYQVAYEGQVTADREGERLMHPDVLESELDRVMEQLLKLKADDATVGGAMARGFVEVSLTVEAASLEDALAKGNTVIRTAIHAAGGFTPEWSLDWTSARATKVDELAGADSQHSRS